MPGYTVTGGTLGTDYTYSYSGGIGTLTFLASNKTFVLTMDSDILVDSIVVGGGGGGAGANVNGGGGGGGGETLVGTSTTLIGGTEYNIIVGSGGGGGYLGGNGYPGNQSIFYTFNALGGFGGISDPFYNTRGGNGGGSYSNGGTGGLNGAYGSNGSQYSNSYGGGGGGGANGGGGGNGAYVVNGTPIYGGGGGGDHGIGGIGGGGGGAYSNGNNGPIPGTPNTGGGGGADRGNHNRGGSGGSGIVIISAPGLTCFKEDTKILTDQGYKLIQDLRKGDLVQTLNHGFKSISMIGSSKMYNSDKKERKKTKLYKYTSDHYPEIFEDLIITGGHSILVDELSEDQKSNTLKYWESLEKVDDKYRLLAVVDEKSQIYEEEGIFKIYHFALESDDETKAYGIYANGLLVESCPINYFKNHSGMTIIE